MNGKKEEDLNEQQRTLFGVQESFQSNFGVVENLQFPYSRVLLK